MATRQLGRKAARDVGHITLSVAVAGKGAHAQRLMSIFAQVQGRLDGIVARAVLSGRLRDRRYRRKQRAEIRRVLGAVQVMARQESKDLTVEAFTALAPGFDRPSTLSNINRQAISTIADSLSGRLADATVTVGRTVDDVFKREGLRLASEQLLAERTESDAASVLAGRLRDQGVHSFTDKAGRRWTLDRYARMAVRTTAAEAASEGVRQRVLAAGWDLVRIPSHQCSHHPADPEHPCRKYEGRTLSLTGRTPGFDRLDRLPPFHPQCLHVIAPAPQEFE